MLPSEAFSHLTISGDVRVTVINEHAGSDTKLFSFWLNAFLEMEDALTPLVVGSGGPAKTIKLGKAELDTICKDHENHVVPTDFTCSITLSYYRGNEFSSMPNVPEEFTDQIINKGNRTLLVGAESSKPEVVFDEVGFKIYFGISNL